MKLIRLARLAQIAQDRGLRFGSYCYVGHSDFGTLDKDNYSSIHLFERGQSIYSTPLFDIRDGHNGCTIDTHLGDHPGYVETDHPKVLALLARPEMDGIAKWLGVADKIAA